jgi:hypothetical protein
MPDKHWRGCRVESSGDAGVSVIDDEAARALLDRESLLAPTALTELNVRQRFDRNAKRRAFVDGARAAGHPHAPHGWRPALDERVLAVRDGAWVGARVRGFLKKGGVRLIWDEDKRSVDMSSRDVVPQPPVDFSPTVGSFVLARPQAGSRNWTVVRVESVGGSNLVVSNEVGDQIPLSLRDVLPLERYTDASGRSD